MAYVLSHSGAAGDLIYAMSTFKTLGNVELHLFPGCKRVDFPELVSMTKECGDALKPFLESQSYIVSATWGPEPVNRNCDEWRKWWKNGLNLADMFANYTGVPHWPRETPWLSIPQPNRVSPVVIHRSARYHNSYFPWPKIMEKYRKHAIFVGLSDEHAAFSSEFGELPYYKTKDYLELAKVIAGCELFIGNQSSPYAIAEGLKMQTIQEVCLGAINCHFGRERAIYCMSGPIVMPDLENSK